MSITYPLNPALQLGKVYTIGYREPDALQKIDQLMADSSTILVDIRYSPKSSNLHWTKAAFSKKYQKRYKWMQSLGNVNYKQEGNIKIADPEASIQQVIALLQVHSVILMCGCAEYETCHRKVVFELLQAALTPQHVEATCFLPVPTTLEDIILRENALLIWFTHGNAPKGGTIPLTREETTYTIISTGSNSHKAAAKLNGKFVDLLLSDEEVEYAKEYAYQQMKEYYAKGVEATCFSEPSPHELPNEKKLPRATTKLKERITELEHIIETMHASRIYKETQPDATLADLQMENVRQREAVADYLEKLEQLTEAHTAATQTVLEQDEQLHILEERDRQHLAYRDKAQHLIERLLQRRHPQQAPASTTCCTCQQLATRYGNVTALLDDSAKMIPITVFNQERERNRQREEQRKKLLANPVLKSAQKIALDILKTTVERGTTHDAEGRTRVNATTIASQMGMSPSTGDRFLDFCETQLPTYVDLVRYPETLPDGTETKRPYIKLNPNISPDQIAPLDFKKQGGDKYTCAQCGGKHVKIKRKVVRTLVCDDCGHKSHIDEVESEDFPNQSYTKEDAKKHCSQKNDAIIITSNPPPDVLTEAATLLLAVAGSHDRHITMPRRHASKYLEVKAPLTLDDLMAHLRGAEAKGAPCSYPDDQTRSLAWDADEIEAWAVLQRAARILVQHGYLPLLEESPADRGGHLWIIVDSLVNATAARERVYELVPELREIVEYWPAPLDAKKWNRVRLPGGFYSRNGEQPVKGWCKIAAVATGEISRDGQTAAALLLANQTSAAVVIVATASPQDETAVIEQARNVAPRAVSLPNNEETRFGSLPNVDEAWIARFGPVEKTTLWFAICASYAARWYNERHTLDEIHPRERNKKALSPNGSERTASTDYYITADGERYTDHSTHGKRSDGTKDTGDALELAVKVQGLSKGALLRDITKEINTQARAELESAASTGHPIPVWLEEIITPAGRRQYMKLRNQLAKGIDKAIEQFTEQFVQQPDMQPVLAELGRAVAATTIYVDDIATYEDCKLPYKQWCHMATSGDIEDLHAIAKELGLKREWFQDHPTHPHYDLTPNKRQQAIKLGAKPVQSIELIRACHPVLASVASAPQEAPTEMCQVCQQNEVTYIGDKRYCEACKPQRRSLGLGVRCEICRFSEAFYIWIGGKHYCKACHAKEEQQLREQGVLI